MGIMLIITFMSFVMFPIFIGAGANSMKQLRGVDRVKEMIFLSIKDIPCIGMGERLLLVKAIYGSWCYGTTGPDSDIDVFCVPNKMMFSMEFTSDVYSQEALDFVNKILTEDEFEFTYKEYDIHFISVNKYMEWKRDMNIRYLEAWSYQVSAPIPYLDMWKVRQEISHIASNSFVKAKKKMTVEKDYDLYIAKKSLFHSLRVLMYGRQIAEKGYIYDFYEARDLWNEINSDPSTDWEHYKEKYKPLHNKLHSEFVALCPKVKIV